MCPKHVQRYVQNHVQRHVQKHVQRYVLMYVQKHVLRYVQKHVQRHVQRYVQKTSKIMSGICPKRAPAQPNGNRPQAHESDRLAGRFCHVSISQVMPVRTPMPVRLSSAEIWEDSAKVSFFDDKKRLLVYVFVLVLAKLLS